MGSNNLSSILNLDLSKPTNEINEQEIWDNPEIQEIVKKLNISFEEFKEHIFLFLVQLQNKDKNLNFTIERNNKNKLIRKIYFINKPEVDFRGFLIYKEEGFAEYEDIFEKIKNIDKLPDLSKIFTFYKNNLSKILKQNKWIFWYGGTSNWRSTLLKFLAIMFAKKEKTVVYFDMKDFYWWMYSKPKNEYYNIIRKIKSADVFVLEGVSFENLNLWTTELINQILNSRSFRNDKITFISSNQDITQLQNTISTNKNKLNYFLECKKFVDLIKNQSRMESFGDIENKNNLSSENY